MPASAADLLLLDNIVWHSLKGPHAAFAAGTRDALRYGRGFPAMAGFADPDRPVLDALRPACDAGEPLYTLYWNGPAPAGWRVELEDAALQYVWDAPAPAPGEDRDLVRLGRAHVARMVALAALTRPGPFGERNVEMGEYYGILEGERLVSMAGERLAAGALHEVSAVCTHPNHQGRGLAGRLMRRVIRAQLARGETPFLHVMKGNAGAQALYERMGFRKRREIVVRVLALATAAVAA